MPYTISKNDDGEFCVFKMDDEDNPTGATLGCHASNDEAGAQISAIEKEEGEKAFRLTQLEVQFKELSDTGQACETCRYLVGADYCHLIENLPYSVSEKSICEKWDARPNVVVEAAPVEAPIDVPLVNVEAVIEDEPEYGYIAPTSNQKGFLQSIKEKLLPGMKPGQSVFRGADGRRYMMIVTSNSYQDRQIETMSSKALQRYVDSCWPADDYFRSDNVLQVWHHDQLTVGDIVWADMAGPFLVELSKERDDVISKAAWDYWQSEEGGKDLGASHRYLYRKQDLDADGTLHLLSKFETSPLPRLEAAANLLTFSGVIPMSKSRDKYLDDMFGIEGVAELLKDGPQKLAEKLAEAGVQHKSVDEPTTEEAVQNAEDKFAPLLLQMIEAQADNAKTQADILARLEKQDEVAEGTDTRFGTVDEQLKALSDEMKVSPRASEAAETVVTDEAEKKNIQDKNITYDKMFPGMEVPLEGTS